MEFFVTVAAGVLAGRGAVASRPADQRDLYQTTFQIVYALAQFSDSPEGWKPLLYVRQDARRYSRLASSLKAQHRRLARYQRVGFEPP